MSLGSGSRGWTQRDPDSELDFITEIKKKKFLRLKNFEVSQKIFFLISLPKCIELTSESGSRWVLGLGLGYRF